VGKWISIEGGGWWRHRLSTRCTDCHAYICTFTGARACALARRRHPMAQLESQRAGAAMGRKQRRGSAATRVTRWVGSLSHTPWCPWQFEQRGSWELRICAGSVHLGQQQCAYGLAWIRCSGGAHALLPSVCYPYYCPACPELPQPLNCCSAVASTAVCMCIQRGLVATSSP